MATETLDRPGPLQPAELREPPIARFLFADPRASILWLIVRLYLGWEWLQAGYEKITSPVWTGAKSGVALTGFVNGALKQTGGDHPNVQGWYGTFLQDVVLPHASLWSHLVAYGETLVGIALILGVLTGIAAFFGILMNANYLLAGAVSTNPILIILGTLVMLAWRNAGWLGVDRWLLPLLGTPWQPGSAFRGHDAGPSGDDRVAAATVDRRTGDRRAASRPAGDLPDPAYDPSGAAAYQNRVGMRRETEYDTGAARGYGAPVQEPADAVEPTRVDDTAGTNPSGDRSSSASSLDAADRIDRNP